MAKEVLQQLPQRAICRARQMRDLPVDYLRQIYLYDPETGAITHKERPLSMFAVTKYKSGTRSAEWSQRRWNTMHANKSAIHKGLTRYGQKTVAFNGACYLAHRVAWALHYGEIDPSLYIDHINGDPTDNRICNLRLVDHGENMRNRKVGKGQAQNGAFGVRLDKRVNKWTAMIGGRGRRVWLGQYATRDEAIEARLNAEREFGYHTNHGQR